MVRPENYAAVRVDKMDDVEGLRKEALRRYLQVDFLVKHIQEVACRSVEGNGLMAAIKAADEYAQEVHASLMVPVMDGDFLLG